MSTKPLFPALTIALVLFLLFASLALAQSPERQQGKPREITSEDFPRDRPAAKTPTPSPPTTSSSVPRTNTPRRRRVYHLAKTLPAPTRRKPYTAPPTNVTVTTPVVTPGNMTTASYSQEQIGITLWRLRPSTSEDTGPTIRVATASGIPSFWTPVRVSEDHIFSPGDFVRLTVESPRSGYLYVIDREQYADNTLGDAKLIFPTTRTRGGDNRVEAGTLIDIPAWTDSVPYFVMNSPRQNYAGELLTFIVTPRPLSIVVGERPLSLTKEQVEGWESDWGTEADLYEMEGGVGESQTAVEQQAQSHYRQLTQEDPVPQTIYRLVARKDSPFLINVSVKAGKK